jgi:hypothetical protein
MRCLTPRQVQEMFGPAGFSIMSNVDMRRIQLVLAPQIASRQDRVGGRPGPDVDRLRYFAEALIRWHPPATPRLLFVSAWNWDFPSVCDLFVAARNGLGETRPLLEAPAHYFDPYAYDERDQTEISREQARETGILAGLIALIMIDGWDGWLIAGNADRIEFWEGNIFFYSHEAARLAAAEALMTEFECPRTMG